MKRTLEIIFPKLHLLVLIVALPLMISLAIAYSQPRSYQASADLWALRQYSFITVTGLNYESGSPADTQVATLYELIQTRSFALTVAKATDLPSTFDSSIQSDPQSLDDALVSAIQSVHVGLPIGAHLFTISYVNTNPKIAQEVIQTLVQTYSLQSQRLATSDAILFLEEYQAQLLKAKQDVDAAAAAEAQYLAKHPALATDPAHGAAIDPQVAQLNSEVQQAQAEVQSIQQSITSLNQSINTAGSGANDLFRVIDPPIVRRASRTKDYIKSGGIGAGIAIPAGALYLAFLFLRNRGVYTPLDLQKVSTYRFVVELPRLTPAAVALLVARSACQPGKNGVVTSL